MQLGAKVRPACPHFAKPRPHPDDVVIDYERGVRFIGPVDEEQAARLEETCKMRDVLILQVTAR